MALRTDTPVLQKVENALGGQNVRLGKVSIVELWAARCGPCVAAVRDAAP